MSIEIYPRIFVCRHFALPTDMTILVQIQYHIPGTILYKYLYIEKLNDNAHDS
jgi:hypothetical protein